MHKSRSSVFSIVAALILLVGVSTVALTTAQRTGTSTPPPAAQAVAQISAAPEVTVNKGTVVAQERFDAQPATWTYRNRNIIPEYRINWDVQASKLVANTGAAGTSLDQELYLAPTTVKGSYTVATQVYPQNSLVTGLAFEASDAGYYLFRVFAGNSDNPHRYTLQRYDPKTDQFELLVDRQDGDGFVYDQWQELRVEREGSKITCFVDGKVVLEAKDDVLTGGGQAGLYALNTGTVLFDNFTVAQQ